MHRAPRAYTLGEARTVYLSHEQRFRFTQKAQVGGGGVWLFEDEGGGGVVGGRMRGGGMLWCGCLKIFFNGAECWLENLFVFYSRKQ